MVGGLHECSRCGDGSRKRKRAGLGNYSDSFQLFFFAFFFSALLLRRASELGTEMCSGSPRGKNITVRDF